MELEEIRKLAEKLPVAENAVLFLWCPNSVLQEALQILNAWGFEYKVSFVWWKRRGLFGNYCRSEHEYLLLGTKGEIGTPVDKSFSSVIDEERIGRHSEKPQSVYTVIERMYPKHRFLELFARNKRENWTSWGNEV
jgi:N6-adenosine-specific RNA methylase IME4